MVKLSLFQAEVLILVLVEIGLGVMDLQHIFNAKAS